MRPILAALVLLSLFSFSSAHLSSKYKSHRILKCSRHLTKENSRVHISGDVCCDAELEMILRKVREHSSETLGDTAKFLQRRIQKLRGHSFEAIISSEDFAVASHYRGQRVCKVKTHGLHVLVYQTPAKYDLSNNLREAFMATIDAQEDLGSTLEVDREDWPDIREDPLADLGAGTHCKRARRDGNKCCSRQIYEMIVDVENEVSTSPVYNTSRASPGVVANVLKKLVQSRFARAFEIIVSRDDFATASWAYGDFTCKIFYKGLYALAYETPHQSGYHPYNRDEEKEYSKLSDRDPLGTPLFELPGQIKVDLGVQLETEGYRIGFPKGSHCDQDRMDGSRCCHMELFSSMHNSILDMKSDDLFSSIDRRIIATNMRKAAELAINEPLEMVISNNDFVVSTNHVGDCVCKFKADHYHIMAWRTPGNWSVGVEMFADNGHTSFVGCKTKVEHLEGATCCNKTLRFEITKRLHENSRLDFSQMDTNEVSRILSRSAQAEFNSHVETVVSRGNFHWRSPGNRSQHTTCKVDLFQFHALIFRTGGTYRYDEFLNSDVEPSELEKRSIEDQPDQPDQQNQEPNQDQNQQQQQSQQNQQNQQQQSQQQQQQQQTQNQQQQQQQLLRPPTFWWVPFQAPPLPPPPPPVPAPPPLPPPVFPYGFQCFSKSTWATTPQGRRRMDELQVGDYVLTANANEVYFSPITLWLHREPEMTAKFIEIRTETGRLLELSPRHLIYAQKCLSGGGKAPLTLPTSGEVFADSLIVGECLFVADEDHWSVEPIASIRHVERTDGIYAPLTANGRILVNGVLTSCYTDFNWPTVQNSYFKIALKLRKYFYGVDDWVLERRTGLPTLLETYSDLLRLVIPFFSI